MEPINISVSLTSADGLQSLATASIVWVLLCHENIFEDHLDKTTLFVLTVIRIDFMSSCRVATLELSNWTKVELQLEAKGSNANSRLQLTTTKKGAIWFDQVSLMPVDTYKVIAYCLLSSCLSYNCLHLLLSTWYCHWCSIECNMKFRRQHWEEGCMKIE